MKIYLNIYIKQHKPLGKFLQELNSNIGEPYIKYLDDGLLEIRAKGQEGIGRSIFCYQKRQKIIILHYFIKKSQKMPKKEFQIALQRKKDLENDSIWRI